MNCDKCQSRICELLDTGQNTRHDPILEQHLAECPACREFHGVWTTLDAQLTRHALEAALPADFTTTLLARLPASHSRLTTAEIAAKRAQFEREYRATMAAMGGRYLFSAPSRILQLLAVAGAFGFAGLLLAEAMGALLVSITEAFSPIAPWKLLLVCWLIGLAALLYGVRRLPVWGSRWFRLALSFTRTA